jgi:hypothetical protein
MKLSGKWITVPLVRRVMGMPGHQPSSFNGCVGAQLTGTHNRPHTSAAITAFTEAVNKCKGKGRGRRSGVGVYR